MPSIFVVLFIVSLLPMTLAIIGGYLRFRQFDQFDNHHPRQQQTKLSGLAARIYAAQQNAWESLIFYAVACLLAFISSIDLDTLSYAALLFLACRILHPVFYALNQASFRSLVFMVGWLANVYIAVRSLLVVSL
ncbi:putative membrane protein [Methylophaga frappieri]|uniref:Putative membrane protein n=1 Tax=Methylophaga frappieri (strain ATCC BAA-2434 / DSM 25690 / JAM7) TaxID=754477 RepID=I1YJK6_METFJ|nr:MAPEG family protein [Methylophaga frappieri]AFJ03099.1 putative membrane protein [Methylophaga frappieri]